MRVSRAPLLANIDVSVVAENRTSPSVRGHFNVHVRTIYAAQFHPPTRANGKNTNIVKVLAIFGIVGLFLLLAVTATAATFNPADYDANGDCVIDRSEVFDAIEDYFDGDIARDDVFTLIEFYFSGDRVCPLEPTVPPPEDLAGDQESTSLSAMVKRVRPSVVMVVSRADPVVDYLSSGFIFQVQGNTAYVLTNQHSVDWSKTVQIVVNDEDTYTGTVVNRNAADDLAVVKICCGSFEALEFGDVSTLEVGDDVVSIGYPLDFLLPRNVQPWYPHEYIPASVTKGIVSAFRYRTNTDTRLIQHDGAISGGSSGSPLFDLEGKVVGINVSRIPPWLAENMSLAISAVTVQERLPNLLVQATDYTFGPVQGSIDHSTIHIDQDYADGFWAQDLEAEARFHNPYAVSEGNWSYGLILRDDGSKPRIYFLVAHFEGDPYWRIFRRKGADWTILAEGDTGNIKTGFLANNHVRVRLVGQRGTFYVNGTAVSTNLNLGADVTHAGYVAAAANFYVGHGKLFRTTEYDGFYGRGLD